MPADGRWDLNPICHLLALLATHHILHVSRIRLKGLNLDVRFLHGSSLQRKEERKKVDGNKAATEDRMMELKM